MKISIIVPVYNGLDTLPHLLSALAAQTYPAAQTEILCIDNNSTDGSADVIKAWTQYGVRYLSCPRQGSYAARNVGIAHAGGAILAFTDADCRPTPAWIRAGVDQMVHHNLDRLAGAIHLPLSTDAGIWERVDASFYLDQQEAVAQGWAATANLLVRRTVIDQVGPFEDALMSWGDIEFGRRCTTRGLSIGFAPHAMVIHAPRRRATQIVRRSWRSGLGHAQVTHRHLPVYHHSWRKLLPRPLSHQLRAERLGSCSLTRRQHYEVCLLRYGAVDLVHMVAYGWGRCLARPLG